MKDKEKRILIAAGGTGGHIYPAIGVAEKLLARSDRFKVLFIGEGLSKNSFFDREKFCYKEVPSATLSSKNPKKMFLSLRKIWQGIKESRIWIRQFQPHLVLGFGSFHTLPPLLAAKIEGVPFVLHEANSVPGKVNRLLSRWAVINGIHFPITAKQMRGKTVEVGMPLRKGYGGKHLSKANARNYFSLHPTRPTLLVFGGSQGAFMLNKIVCESLLSYRAQTIKDFQLIHITGNKMQADHYSMIYRAHGICACVLDFEERMDLAWTAADLVISRSGACSIAEQIEFEVPGILVPYPYATDDHQRKNAEYMTTKVGGAIRCDQKELTSEKLIEILEALSKNRYTLLRAMRKAIQLYKRNRHKSDLTSLIDFLSENYAKK